MGFGKIVYSKINQWGIPVKIYNEQGIFVGDDKIIFSPAKRSVEENIASFGRIGYLHNKTLEKPGYLMENTLDGHEYFISAFRSVGVKKEIVTWSAFFVQVNAHVDIYRQVIASLNEDTGQATYEWQKVISNFPIYIEKKDWTMEEMTRYGRNQKGYEMVQCQIRDIQKGDRMTLGNKTYQIQDVNTVLHENMLRLQVGVDLK